MNLSEILLGERYGPFENEVNSQLKMNYIGRGQAYNRTRRYIVRRLAKAPSLIDLKLEFAVTVYSDLTSRPTKRI